MEYDEQELRTTPQSDIDLQMMLTDPKWGQDVPRELREKLKIIVGEYMSQDENGQPIRVRVEEGLWGLLSYYTRDIRLGNLSNFNGELEYCRYFLDLAGDCLRSGYLQSFLKSLTMAVTIIETSQSKGGFLRKRQNTLTQEKMQGELEPKKSGLLGGSKKSENYGG